MILQQQYNGNGNYSTNTQEQNAPTQNRYQPSNFQESHPPQQVQLPYLNQTVGVLNQNTAENELPRMGGSENQPPSNYQGNARQGQPVGGSYQPFPRDQLPSQLPYPHPSRQL